MKIRYIGHSCFWLETAAGTRIVIDPFDGIGWKMPRVTADFVCCTHGHFDHGYTDGVHGWKETVSAPGEYACAEVKIIGISSFHDDRQGGLRGNNVIYRIEADGAVVCHMGDIGQEPDADLVHKIGRPDVLMLPVGGRYTVDAAGALAYVRAIGPKTVLPMHYKTEDCTLDIAPPDKFLALFGEDRCVSADEYDTADADKYSGKAVVLRRWTDGR